LQTKGYCYLKRNKIEKGRPLYLEASTEILRFWTKTPKPGNFEGFLKNPQNRFPFQYSRLKQGAELMDLSKHLSKKDAIDLLELTYKASQCYNPDKFGPIVLELRNLIDFDHSFCAYGNPSEGAENAIDVLGCGGFLDTLLGDKIYENDPVALELFKTWQIQYWPDVYKKYPVKEIISLEKDMFGTNAGYSCGTRDFLGDYGAVFTFAGKKLKKSSRVEAVLEYTVPHLSETLIRLSRAPKESGARAAKLTKREVEVLKWTKEGKTSFETSVILSISERTVNFHVGNILKKLDAINRVQAVAAALEKGIIGW
jgi:DNA-binding CsgD family transcriptional regulator